MPPETRHLQVIVETEFSSATSPIDNATSTALSLNPFSPLLNLPAELVERVATFLPGSDLSTLRLVNKEIAAKTQCEMLSQNFSELHIMLALRQSLNKAMRVVECERFRNSVQKRDNLL